MQDPTLNLILRSWSWQPTILLGLGLLAVSYIYAYYNLRKQGLLQEGPIKRRQAWYFAAGWATLFIALLSPIDTLSGTLFTMHMTQHVLLIMVAAPLILMGLPASFLTPVIQNVRLKGILALLTHPFVAFVLYNVTLAVWHLPVFYEAALQYEILHALEHAMFLGTALLSWWPLLSPTPKLPRLPYPAQMLYIFLIAIPAGILGAVLVFADRVFYPTYAAAPQLWELTALADQQIGALIMMVPTKMVYLIILTVVFFTWFNEEEDYIGHHYEHPLQN